MIRGDHGPLVTRDGGAAAIAGFAVVLAEGAEILRTLSRRATPLTEAGKAIEEWAGRHPGACPRLVPGDRDGYGLLLRHPEGGVVTLSVPRGERHRPDGPDEVAERCLPPRELVEDDEPLEDGDLREAVAELRARRGLHDRAATLAWLAETPWSGEQFEALVAGIARRRRFRRRKQAELGPGHLASHRSDFDRVRALWVTGSQPVDGELLHCVSGLTGYEQAMVTVGERWAGELPAPLRHAGLDALVGPVPYGDGYLTGVVLDRRAARDDPETLAAAGEAAFGEWLVARRRRASVECHWI
ncbi:hypothetical protein [Microbispora triticiradicis]|uniref:GNAT family N-acetyltransferase n=2 Tax=Microbispora TaxID=2005 RepID=A0ABY3LV09_9ACTN|nr:MULTISPECIES: hypothetical protein [Microbispora]TLP57990.1 hypothetical protein FED44_20825 [Microbispora fusca]TYB56293.1 hypothetical protein FXF59_20775 [Microbispora tritici]